jgi:hypothetical protein
MSKMLVALALAVMVAVGATFATTPTKIVVRPLTPNDKLPTFAQVQAEARGETYVPPVYSPNDPPWVRSEPNALRVRQSAREDTLIRLGEVSRRACQRGDGERFAKALGYYLEQRGMQERGYAANWGREGAQFIAQAWSTPDDLRIIEMTRAAYQGGRFVIGDFESRRRQQVARLIGDAKPGASRCG